MKIKVFIILILLVTSSTLFGGEMLNSFKSYEYKSPNFARSFALGNTVFPLFSGIMTSYFLDNEFGNITGKTLLFYGTVIGPSTGNYYARDMLRGTGGILIRISSMSYIYNVGKSFGVGNGFLVLGSTLAFIGSIGWNVLSASTSAIEYNDEYYLSITPMYDIENRYIGLNLSMQF